MKKFGIIKIYQYFCNMNERICFLMDSIFSYGGVQRVPTPTWKYYLCKAYSYLYRKILAQTQQTSEWYAHSSFPSEKRNALAKVLQQGNYDVIIGVHAPLAVRLAACRKQLGSTKLIGWIHNSYKALFGEKSLYIGSELRKHYEWQLEKLDATVVLSLSADFHIDIKALTC